MKPKNRKTAAYFTALAVSASIFLCFQNCSKVAFQSNKVAQLSNVNANAVNDGTPADPAPTPNPSCESSGKLWDANTKTCVEFSCKSFVTLQPISAVDPMNFEVPARTADGICYTVKLMSAIANSSSTLTANKDSDVISANHDAHTGTWSPYQLGTANVQFIMRAGGGARAVKLSGSGDGEAPIKVDNFVLAGLATKAQGLSLNAAYNSYGTTDSTVDGSNIIFRNQKLPLNGFGPGGTSTIGTLDITTRVSTEEPYVLDVRALDCGGARELSNIYLLFQ